MPLLWTVALLHSALPVGGALLVSLLAALGQAAWWQRQPQARALALEADLLWVWVRGEPAPRALTPSLPVGRWPGLVRIGPVLLGRDQMPPRDWRRLHQWLQAGRRESPQSRDWN